jgi:hypothetical protein
MSRLDAAAIRRRREERRWAGGEEETRRAKAEASTAHRWLEWGEGGSSASWPCCLLGPALLTAACGVARTLAHNWARHACRRHRAVWPAKRTSAAEHGRCASLAARRPCRVAAAQPGHSAPAPRRAAGTKRARRRAAASRVEQRVCGTSWSSGSGMRRISRSRASRPCKGPFEAFDSAVGHWR